jgi:hypothetical protein
MGGSGSSGGGSTSGTVDFPDYMKDYHGDFLEVAWLIIQEDQQVGSPYNSFSTSSPNVTFGFGGWWKSPVSCLEQYNSWSIGSNVCEIAAKACLEVIELTGLPDRISEYTLDMSTALGERLTQEVLPRFEAGMRDIGAVCSSAFAIGRAVMENTNSRIVGRTDAEARLQHLNFYMNSWLTLTQQQRQLAVQITMAEAERHRLVAVVSLEIARLYTAARYDIDIINVEMAAKDRRWDMENLQYAANVLAGISGAAVTRAAPVNQSSIGGAVSAMASGAAMGAMAGSVIPGVGTMWGAAIGAGLGLLSSLF